MSLSKDLISQFVKATKDTTTVKKESTVYGTVVKYNEKTYVKIDGSDLLTPAETLSSVEEGERVSIMIKDHTATITGNYTAPSASSIKVDGMDADLKANTADIKNLVAKNAEIENLVATKATIEDLQAANAEIDTLKSNYAEIETLVADKASIGDLEAVNADIKSLKADKADIAHLEANYATIGSLNAVYADVTRLEADKANVTDLTATNAEIDNLKANKADIEFLEANYATIRQLDATNANVTNLQAETANINTALIDKANVSDLTATNAVVADLKAGKADVADLSAANAKIANLEANKADVSVLEANYATIKQLDATNANVENLQTETANINTALIDKANVSDLNATNANITNLQATKADVTELNAAKANITTLTSDLADITTLVNGNLTSDNIQSMVITGDKFTVEDAFIKDAMIDSINANKINTGVINTNNVSIQSNDGSMILQGNLQQFKDENGNVRIQIGKDTSGNFTFVLYDENGTGQLINQNGIQSSDAIADGLIVDAKVADNANIAGSKLDIDSVVTEVNNGSTNIKGTKIYLDDQNQTLNVAFNNMSNTVSGNTSTLESHTTSINTMNGEISQLISDTTITKQDGTTVSLKDAYNSTVDTVNSHTQTIGSLETNLNKVSTGQNKWLLEMFEKGDGIDAESPITIKDIMGKTLIKAILVEDSVTSNQSQFGNQYLGRATTYVYLDEDYNWETTATSDDGSTIYINGVAIATLGTCTPTAVTVPFKQGWNKITWVYNEGIGGDGWDFNPRLTTLSQVKYMNAYPMTNVDEVGNTLDGDIKTVSSKQTALEQNLDGFKQTVSETYATNASLTNVSNNLQNNYSTTSAMNSAIEQKANEITSSVSETYATKESLTTVDNKFADYSTTSAMNSAINQKANEITSSVSETYATKSSVTDLSNNLTNNYSTTSAMNSAINQKANEITSSVSEIYTTKAEFNNLEIGGTNLVLNSSFANGSNNWNVNGNPWPDIIAIDESMSPTGKALKVTANTTAGGRGIWQRVRPRKTGNYTLSFYAKADTDNYNIDAGQEGSAIKDFVLTTNWTKYTHTYNKDNLNSNAIIFYTRENTSNCLFYIHSIKLEYGNKATSWSPAPEDINANITAVDNKFVNYSTTTQMNSAINQKANEITSSVSETYATKTSVTDLSNNITNNYSTTAAMNSAINQKANEITSSVSETYATKTSVTDLSNNLTNNYSTTAAMNSAIQQKANEITSSVSETYATKTSVTDLSNNLTNNYSTTAAMNSAIQQKANEITSTVSETYTTKAEFNNLDIGGRNLVKNSNFAKGSSYWPLNWATSISDTILHNGHKSLRISASGQENHGWFGCTQTVLTDIKPNTTITVSCWYYVEDKSTFDDTFGLELKGKIGELDRVFIGVLTYSNQMENGVWKKIVATGTTDCHWDSLYIYTWVAKNGTVYVTDLKVELGNKATDWTPAPEDIDDSITAVDNKFVNYSTTTQMNSAIEQKANEITSSVSETYATKTSVTDLSNNLTNNYSTTAAMNSVINQKSDSILSTVSNNYATKNELSTVDGKFANYSTTSAMNSAINQKGDSILSTVSNTYTTKAEFNNLEIGGTNLVLNSSFANNADRWAINGVSWSDITIIDESTSPTGKAIKITVNSTAGGYGIWQHVKPRKTGNYTLSFYAKADTDNYNIDAGQEGSAIKDFVLTTNWTKYTHTYNKDNLNSNAIIFYTRENAANGAFYLHSVKLEYGNKATDWTPAPEDINASITAVDNKFVNYSTTTQMNSVIDQKANEINLNVSNTYATKTSVNDLNNNLINNYSTTQQMNSAIDIAKSGIKLDVSQNYASKHEVAHYFEGENKWKLDVYSLGSMSANAYPTKETMIQNNCQYQRSYLVEHPSHEGEHYGDNYVGYATTYMHFTADYQWNGRVVTDDNGNVYLNDVLVLSTPTCQWTNITLNFKAGWNKLEVLYAEGGGGDGWQFDSEIVVVPGGVMNKMNCYGQNSTEEYLKANYSTTQQMNSSIEQKANEITSSVSSMYSTKTETDDKIHNVRVGGTNLFRGTTNLDSLYWSQETAWLTDSYYKGSRIYRVNHAWGNYDYPVRYLFEDAVIELWTEYTFSCYARSNTEDYKPDLCIFGDSAHMEGHGLYIGTVTTEWRQYSGKIKIYDGDRSYPLRIEPTTGSGDGNKYIEVCGLQLEKGNKATDWSPSPRDTDVVNPNLLKNGRFKSIQPNAVDNVPDWTTSGGVTVWTSIGQPGYDRYGCIYFHKASCDGGGCYLYQDLNLDDIGRGIPVTLSFDAWREGTISEVGCNVEYFNADKSSMLASKSLNANDFNGHRSYTFVTLNDVNAKYLRVVFYYISSNGATGGYLATIGNVKLEHGLCETAWSQSEYENMYAYYTTKSELQQTTNSITAKFSESGGYNLLRNSRALKGTSYWTDNGGGISVDGGNPPTIDHKYFCTNFPGGITYYDWIQLENNTHYIYSAKIYVASPIPFNGIVPLHHWCTADKTSGQSQLSIVRCSHDGQTIPAGQWVDVWVEYLTASSGAVWFKPFIYQDGSSCAISVTDLMLCKGSIPSPWSPHPSEVYDGITQIDKDGIKVYHNNIDGDNYTHMAPTGFYLKNKGEDVFKVDAAGLYLKGNVHITNGSVPSNLLNGQISDGLIGEWIRNGATNGSNAKSTLDNNAGNWDNAYNRVVDWAYGSVGGRTTINGGLLQTNTVTTQHLAIGDFNNYSQLVPGQNLSNRYGYASWTGNGDHYYWFNGDSGYLPFTINETVNPFKQGDKVAFKFEAYVQTEMNVTIGVWFYSDDYASAYMTERTAGVHLYPGWNGYSAQVTIDCNETKWARSVAIMIGKNTSSDYIEVRNVVIARMTGNVMIEDGAITASKISAGAVTADKINVTDLSALNASIGGFSMYSGKLVGTGGNGVGMSGNGDDWAFWAGSNTGGNAPFHVGHEGNLYATQAYITGTITSSTINGGTINGGVINGSVVNSDSFIGDLLAIDGTISAKSLQVEDIDNAKYPGAVTADFRLYVSTSGNDDSEIENGATFATFDGLLDKLPKNLNGHEVRIEMSTDITENVDFKGFFGGKIRLYMKGHTLYGYLVSRMGSARINVNSGYIGNASDTSNGWGKIHPSKGYAVSSYTTTVASVDQGAIGLYNIDVYGADNYLSGSTTKLGVAGQDWGTAYLNGVSYYGCDIGARANAGGRIHDVLSYNVCTKYGFYATTGGYITLAKSEHSGGKSKNYHEADAGKVIVASGATFASGEASVPGGAAPVVPTTKTITIKSTYGDTYRSSVYNSWKKDGTARQGDYGYGDCNGCWFFGDAFSDLEGKTINKVTIKITRQSGGSSAPVGLVVKSHGHSGRPSGAPTYRTTAGTLSLATGATDTLPITNSTILSEISSGAVKGFGIQSTYNSANYAVCSGSVTVKITYTE